MGKNIAISIGINKYYGLKEPLKYAKRDAKLMQEFLLNQAGFEQVLLFSDDSPDFRGLSTLPLGNILKAILRDKFEQPFMEPGDNFWFFFSGHGMHHNGCDYLIPCDGDWKDIEHTAISINFLTERLCCCGADNVILILDACRGQGSKSGEGIGSQTAQVAREKGVVTFFSCSPNQLSYEIDALKHGAFTKAMLEGLSSPECATVGQLNHYLSSRVPELIREHKGEEVQQTPITIAEPDTKSHLIILPQHANPDDISALKIDAFQAEVEKKFELAEQLWIRVFAASFGKDMYAIQAIKRIDRLQIKNEVSSQNNSVSATEIRNEEEEASKFGTLTSENLETEISNLSERGVDYTKLRELLATEKWAEADDETDTIMLLIAGKEKVGYLDVLDIQKYFCEDFRIINQLWLKYSNGHFGFSVQKCIREEFKENLYEFLDRVGWDLDWGMRGYGGTRQTFPKGNFPGRWFFNWYAYVGEDLGMARIPATEDMLWISLDCF